MWTCPKCGERHDDQFDSCWKCSTPPGAAIVSAPADSRTLDCLRCQTRLVHAGKKKFHEGNNWGILGEFGELFENRETFQVYFCPNCGKVEFFLG